MNRWKKEATYPLRVMLPHHQYSRWHDYVLRAAESLGLPIGYREQTYTSIGGELVREREWYTSAPMLDRSGVGGIAGVHLRADCLRQEDDAYARDGLRWTP
jgi:hypothetical protein